MHFSLDDVKEARAKGQAEGYSQGYYMAMELATGRLIQAFEQELEKATAEERKGLELALLHVQCGTHNPHR